MQRIFVTLLIIFSQFSLANEVAGSTEELLRLKVAFEEMRKAPNLDTGNNLKWVFFFSAPDEPKAKSIMDTLVAKGYEFLKGEIDKNGIYWFQAYKIEIHTPESLQIRTKQLRKLVRNYEGAEYDGWEAVEISPPIRYAYYYKTCDGKPIDPKRRKSGLEPPEIINKNLHYKEVTIIIKTNDDGKVESIEYVKGNKNIYSNNINFLNSVQYLEKMNDCYYCSIKALTFDEIINAEEKY